MRGNSGNPNETNSVPFENAALDYESMSTFVVQIPNQENPATEPLGESFSKEGRNQCLGDFSGYRF